MMWGTLQNDVPFNLMAVFWFDGFFLGKVESVEFKLDAGRIAIE